MAKKIGSSFAAGAIHKTNNNKTMKKTINKHVSTTKYNNNNNKRVQNLKKMFYEIMNYMKSDTYMFAPLVINNIPPPFHHRESSSGHEVLFEPAIARNKERKKLLMKDVVEDYMKCDSYMYAPLITVSRTPDHSVSPTTTTTGGHGNHTEQATEEEATAHGENALDTVKDTRRDEHNPTPAAKITVNKHIRVQQETVKRVVHQNCRSPSVPENCVLSQRELRKAVVK